MKLTESDLDARRLASSAAPSWYVLAAAKDLKRAPIGLRGRGEELVVWRGRSGRPIAIDRYCPHHGADLALGDVRDGTLRCAFHGWRFDDQGKCSFLPGEERIPGSAHRRVRRLWEKSRAATVGEVACGDCGRSTVWCGSGRAPTSPCFRCR